jgi:hypothetical protein
MPARGADLIPAGALVSYDETLDRRLADVQRETYASDGLCKPV